MISMNGIRSKLKETQPNIWELGRDFASCMNVPARIFASKILLEKIEDGAIQQAANVACLPGIYKYSLAMPDMHFGYGFPIGGVAAFDSKEGVISPGGIGYDINCGVRLLKTNLTLGQVRPKVKELMEVIFRNVPVGVGMDGKLGSIQKSKLDSVLNSGAKWAVENGYGWQEDLKRIEENGQMKSASSTKISDKAFKRGSPQLGSLGAGNHFLEIQRVEKIYDPKIAKVFGIDHEDQITIMIHTGSRGIGHQICSDYLREMERSLGEEKIRKLPDRELIYAPFQSQLGQDYFASMSAAANYAFCNRQMITHWMRESFSSVFHQSPESLDMNIIYDVCHNIGKLEKHKINGVTKDVVVHRKGATRSFPPDHPDVPEIYRKVGQPVIIPGSMGTASYLLVGTQKAMELSFGSTAHGAGRLMSRIKATKSFRGEHIKRDLENKGISLKALSWSGVAEEAPQAYKDIDEVVGVSDSIGIGKLVAKLKPVGVIKG